MFKIFTSHPNSIGETYWQHFCFATKTGAKLVYGGLACIIHGIFPFLFATTGSDTVLGLADCMAKRQAEEKEKLDDKQ